MAIFRYGFRDSFRVIRAHWGVSLLTLLTASAVFFLVGSTALFSLNIKQMTASIEGDLSIQAFLRSAEDARTVETAMKRLPWVSSVTRSSPDDAMEKLKAKLGNQAKAVTLLGENPLPWTVEIKAQQAKDVSSIVRELLTYSSVDDVVYAGALAERLTRVSLLSGKVAFVVLLTAVLVSALVLFNTIRIAIYSRRQEISVMLLVGATRSYVALPFVLQGIFLGLNGALLAVAIIHLFYADVISSISSALPLLQFVQVGDILYRLYGTLVGTGVVVGWLCSWLAINRFIRQALRPL
ncbi:MAG: cell division protein FtsX [Dethiosulfovibrio peptidovorans]|nr:MAG: cell division protein FtsX [Dethiosulfovibrio peptidovorans]